MKFYLTVCFLLTAKCVFCQTNDAVVAKIDGTAAHIDSLKDCYFVAEDGTVEIIRKGIIKKIFTRRVVGGFSNDYYGDRKTKELYKVEHIQNLRKRQINTYYFNNGCLILVKTTTMDNGPIDNVLSAGQYYFLRDSLIKRTGNDSLAKPVYMLKLSKEFIKSWTEMQDIGLRKK